MRIALVVTGGLDRSGRERVIPALLWLIERLAARHDVHAYVLRYHHEPCTYDLHGATIHDLGRPRGAAAQHHALVQALREDGPFDVIHAYWALPAGLAAVTAGYRLGIPSVLTLDSGELVALPDINYGDQCRWTGRRAVAICLRLAARVTVCTHFMERLARAHGVTPAIVPLGIDTRTFAPAMRPDGPPWRLIHVASLNPVKDQPMLLRAFHRLVQSLPHCHLDIVGEDTRVGEVQRAAHDLGLDGRVTFHGVQPTDALVGLYQRAHVFVLSSRHEAANVATLEAVACGAVPVGTRVGYLADWNATTVPPGDDVALTAALEGTLRHYPDAAATARRFREWTLTHDADWTTAAFARVYAEAATTRPPRRR